MVLSLCRQFHCLPSQVLAEDAYLLRLLAIEREGTPEREAGEGVGEFAE
jgi:hypothetical protein